MNLDEEMRRKIAVSVAAVAVFIGLVFVIGTTFGGGGLSGPGGLALVGALALFVVLMAVVGAFLARSDP